MRCQVLYLSLHIILNTLFVLLHSLFLYFVLHIVLNFYWYRIVHGLCCSLFPSLSGIRTWLLSVRSLCPPTLPLTTTPGGRFSVLASPSWSNPVSSLRLAKPEGLTAQRAHILAQSVKAMQLLVLFQITYYNQATPGVLPYISTDIAGLSSTFYSSFCACSDFLEANKDG